MLNHLRGEKSRQLPRDFWVVSSKKRSWIGNAEVDSWILVTPFDDPPLVEASEHRPSSLLQPQLWLGSRAIYTPLPHWHIPLLKLAFL